MQAQSALDSTEGTSMPIYDYRCSTCCQSFELLVRGSTVPGMPALRQHALERQVSLTAPQGTSQAIIAAGRRRGGARRALQPRAERAKVGQRLRGRSTPAAARRPTAPTAGPLSRGGPDVQRGQQFEGCALARWSP
jgi:putative FmdB family regulatory protein